MRNHWNITPRLTLNAGLRYETTSPYWDDNNRLANLVIDGGSPLYGQYVVAGDSRLPRTIQSADRNHFAPRVGFGGYDITSNQLNVSSTIPLSGRLPARPSPPAPAAYKFDPKATAQIRSWPLRYAIPYVEQWNLSVRKELAKNFVWEVGYVGNHGVKFYGAYEGNQQPVPAAGSVNSWRPLQSITAASILRVEPWANSSYHGVTTKLERRFTAGVSFPGVYTFGRALDMQTTIDLCDGCSNSSGSGAIVDLRNRRLNYGLSDSHMAHRFVLSGLWVFPFGKGNRWPRGSLTQCAWAATHDKRSYFAAQYRRLLHRCKQRALVAVAHSMLAAIWHMLKRDVEYRELGAVYFEKQNLESLKKNYLKKLERLGFKVSLEPIAV